MQPAAPFRLPEAPADTDLVAKYFRALGDPTRLRILGLLQAQGELAAGELTRRPRPTPAQGLQPPGLSALVRVRHHPPPAPGHLLPTGRPAGHRHPGAGSGAAVRPRRACGRLLPHPGGLNAAHLQPRLAAHRPATAAGGDPGLSQLPQPPRRDRAGRGSLRRALASTAEIKVRDISDQRAADQAVPLGSPTIRVDGRDVQPGAEQCVEYLHTCRLYQGPAQPARAPRGGLAAPGAAGRPGAPPATGPGRLGRRGGQARGAGPGGRGARGQAEPACCWASWRPRSCPRPCGRPSWASTRHRGWRSSLACFGYMPTPWTAPTLTPADQ